MSNESKKYGSAGKNKMGVMPVGELLFSMSLPMMLSMLVQALYNIVDSIFCGRNYRRMLCLRFPLPFRFRR